MANPNQSPIREVELYRAIFAITEGPQSHEDQMYGSGIVFPTDFTPALAPDNPRVVNG